ncbi:hypothetical protein BROSI_A2321 [Candidatus Brocadia sinica JPN1]|uniref:Uncharacterized protein n=1 Tax=Candidatus Brocadia sinica JPN1 TaxID=1197129 RepID=A0ABQ0JYG8_9BACT|nr:hypothetical protein BROSI_A2321 [Candidatus Brocadia sinica JPN1]GIK14878.1 MAG: hypothetical protein BroJett002_35850 [Candidatus Brocadia sinica]GJQ19545.1 MAG: hypothetical protein HBSIN01_35040 [Candidatus Brocadia sinica]
MTALFDHKQTVKIDFNSKIKDLRPWGFIARLEKTLGHILHRHKHGQKGPQKKNGNLQN